MRGGVFLLLSLQAMSTVDEHLACQLPPSVLSFVSLLKKPSKFTQAASPGPPERCSSLETLEAAAASARESWLCQGYNVSLMKLHAFFSQKLAKEFLSMAMELSKSPLAALLRQQHVSTFRAFWRATMAVALVDLTRFNEHELDGTRLLTFNAYSLFQALNWCCSISRVLLRTLGLGECTGTELRICRPVHGLASHCSHPSC